jgi:hypothetical protein
MLSRRFFLLIPIAALLHVAGAEDAPTYWIDPSCNGKVGFNDALNEVIWGSGQLADALKSKDDRLHEPLQWLFNFGIAADQVELVESKSCLLT